MSIVIEKKKMATKMNRNPMQVDTFTRTNDPDKEMKEKNINYVKDHSLEILRKITVFFYERRKKNVTKQYLNQQIVTSLAQHRDEIINLCK
jgi:hypothetical protein